MLNSLKHRFINKQFGLLAIVFCMLLGCTKDNAHSDPSNEISHPNGDTPLSEEDNATLEKMSAPLSILDSLTDADGNLIKKTTASSPKGNLINRLLTESVRHCREKSVLHESEGGNKPSHYGITYSYGQNNFLERLRPLAGNSTHRRDYVFGVDCSGFIVTLLQNGGVNIADCGVADFEKACSTAISSDPKTWRMRLVNLGAQPQEKLENGDFVLWLAQGRRHMGLVSVSTNGTRVILQSNGTGYPTTEADQQANLGSNRGVHPLLFQRATGDAYWGKQYQVLRLLEAGQELEGGLMFYLNDVGTEALVCAPTDQSTATRYPDIFTPGTSTDLGTGQSNTSLIVANLGTTLSPASLCDDLTLGGFDDWYLPSRDELFKMFGFLHLNGLGNFAKATYWSSSDFSDRATLTPGAIWCVDFSGNSAFGYKELKYHPDYQYAHHVRAIRKVKLRQ